MFSGSGVKFDPDAVRQVMVWFVYQHMSAGHEVQTCVSLEEKATCIR